MFEEFFGRKPPRYAILSHTWSDSEITFSGFYDVKVRLMSPEPINKMTKTCTQAMADGYDYVWIDNCSIDKSSSAELSEATNSMWNWDRKADRCYVFLRKQAC